MYDKLPVRLQRLCDPDDQFWIYDDGYQWGAVKQILCTLQAGHVFVRCFESVRQAQNASGGYRNGINLVAESPSAMERSYQWDKVAQSGEFKIHISKNWLIIKGDKNLTRFLYLENNDANS